MIKFLLFTASWSAASDEVRIHLKTFQSQLEIEWEEVPLGDHQEMHTQYAVRDWPTMIKLVDNKEVKRIIKPDFPDLILFVRGEDK